MTLCRALALPLAFAALALAGCFAGQRSDSNPASSIPATSVTPPAMPDSVPDAMPRIEPRSRNGNPPFYEVFGKRYFVLSSGVGYVERGVASWYGPGFHQVRTSTGEMYDMYGMTAAHKTLPLPAFVRVTNLQNGRSVVVRVNDRGPFVGNRIIDLSYTAAAKLDMLRNGTAMVEVRTIDAPSTLPTMTASLGSPAALNSALAGPIPASPGGSAVGPLVGHPEGHPEGHPVGPGSAVAPAAANPAAPKAAPSNATDSASSNPTANAAGAPSLFVQAGAFSDPANAERLAQKLRGGSYGKVFVRDDQIAGRRMYRVRIGPVADVARFDQIVAALEHVGINDAHLALD